MEGEEEVEETLSTGEVETEEAEEEKEVENGLVFFPFVEKSNRLPTIGFIQPGKDHDQKSKQVD